MREIRARIAQRHGIELSTQQIQELAARRLESILDPRAIKPALLDQIRRAAGAPPERPATEAPAEPAYTFDAATIYESHRGILRFIRRLLNPLLKLFFNPTPIAQALGAQGRLNAEAARREAERDRQQSEWNALHYQIVQRLVTEVTRMSLEIQALSMRIESLSAKVDFNERRVRGIEGTVHQTRAVARAAEPLAMPADLAPPEQAGEAAVQGGEASRRRRRRRKGRRGGGAPGDAVQPGPATVSGWTAAGPETFPSEPDAPVAATESVDEESARALEEPALAVPSDEHRGGEPALDMTPSAPAAWEEPSGPPAPSVATDTDSTKE
jgi:hypothetical protein